MRVLRLGGEEKALTRSRVRTAVSDQRKGLALDLDEELGLGAHRFDHHHLGWNIGIPEIDMLGTDAVFHALPLARARARNGPAGAQRVHASVSEGALEDIHGRR